MKQDENDYEDESEGNDPIQFYLKTADDDPPVGSPSLTGRLKVAVRRRRIWELYVEGHTQVEIANKLNMNVRTVRHDIEMKRRDVDVSGMLEAATGRNLDRLNKLYMSYITAAHAGDIDSAAMCLKIIDMENKMLGLYAPKRVDVRAIVMAWAEKEGLSEDAEEVMGIVSGLLPEPAKF